MIVLQRLIVLLVNNTSKTAFFVVKTLTVIVNTSNIILEINQNRGKQMEIFILAAVIVAAMATVDFDGRKKVKMKKTG